jgi:hypothetical protein
MNKLSIKIQKNLMKITVLNKKKIFLFHKIIKIIIKALIRALL